MDSKELDRLLSNTASEIQNAVWAFINENEERLKDRIIEMQRQLNSEARTCTCTSCGKQTHEQDIFCWSCGKMYPESEEEE